MQQERYINESQNDETILKISTNENLTIYLIPIGIFNFCLYMVWNDQNRTMLSKSAFTLKYAQSRRHKS